MYGLGILSGIAMMLPWIMRYRSRAAHEARMRRWAAQRADRYWTTILRQDQTIERLSQ